MPLPIPKLDDRKFQDIVDELKSLIPNYCPEWTDHNVSDPGVTLIELFAHVAEIILYRMNRLPEVFQLVLLNLLGEMPKPPLAAETRVAFWLVEARKGNEDPNVANGKSGIEISTIQTETELPIIYTTVEPIRIFAAKHVVTYRKHYAKQIEPIAQWQDLRSSPHNQTNTTEMENGKLLIFSSSMKKGDTMYFGFEVQKSNNNLISDLSNHILRLTFKLYTAQSGFDRDSPPYRWEAFVGKGKWQPCVRIEGSDTTEAFSKKDGSMDICLPNGMQPGTAKEAMDPSLDPPERYFWVKIELTKDNPGELSLQDLRISSVGINVLARNERIQNRKARETNLAKSAQPEIDLEIHGVSTGQWGQRFRLPTSPILQSLSPTKPENAELYPEFLEVVHESSAEQWTEVQNFMNSQESDSHYVVDRHNGEIIFPPALRLPTGEIRYFGRVPRRNAKITLHNYRVGGGSKGNVRKGKINTLRSSHPNIAKVQNLENVENGRDAESLDLAKLRVASLVRNDGLLVSIEDFRLQTWRILTENRTFKDLKDIIEDVLCTEDLETPKQVNVDLFLRQPNMGNEMIEDLRDKLTQNLQHQCLLGTLVQVRTQILSKEDIL